MGLPPSPSQSTWSSESVAKVKEMYCVKVETMTANGETYSLQVMAELRTKSHFFPRERVDDNWDGTYTITFTLITMDGQHVQKSPCDLYVRRQYNKLHNPVQVINCCGGPSGIAIHHSGVIYVVCMDDSSICVFDRAGQQKRTIGSKGRGDGQFNGPHGLFIKGDVMYVADYGNHRIQRLITGGQCLQKCGQGPFGIVIDEEGYSLVNEYSANCLSIFDCQGNKVHTVSNLNIPRGVILDPKSVYRELVSVSLRQGRTINHITAQMHRAALGLYHAKGYTEKDHNLAYLILKSFLLCSHFSALTWEEIVAHNLEAVLLRSSHPDILDQGRLGELHNADSDGQPQRRQAFHHIFLCIDIRYAVPGTSGSKIWAVFCLMCLMDSCCGVHNRTGGFDLKHICKRFRTLYISTKSVFVLGDTVTCSDLQELVAATGHHQLHVLSEGQAKCASDSKANVNLSTAHQISHILEERPEWSRGHQRLKATVDKVNPLSWRGNMKQPKGFSLRCPHGEWVGVTLMDGEDEDSDCDEELEAQASDDAAVTMEDACTEAAAFVKHPNTITIEGKQASCRSKQIHGGDVDLEDWHLKAIFLVQDPYAVLVSCGGVQALAVFRADLLQVPTARGGLLTVSNMTPDQLVMEATQVIGSLMNLVYVAGSNPERDSSFTWNGVVGDQVKVPANRIATFAAHASVRSCSTVATCNTSTLDAIFGSMLQLEGSVAQTSQVINPCLKMTESFPYQDDVAKPWPLCSGTPQEQIALEPNSSQV
ncbi:hypothetical protein EMCRGX_G013944 [Ephydatia muelleri]